MSLASAFQQKVKKYGPRKAIAMMAFAYRIEGEYQMADVLVQEIKRAETFQLTLRPLYFQECAKGVLAFLVRTGGGEG